MKLVNVPALDKVILQWMLIIKAVQSVFFLLENAVLLILELVQTNLGGFIFV